MKKREFQKKAAAALLGKLADVVMELEENPNITITSEYHSSYFKLRKNYNLIQISVKQTGELTYQLTDMLGNTGRSQIYVQYHAGDDPEHLIKKFVEDFGRLYKDFLLAGTLHDFVRIQLSVDADTEEALREYSTCFVTRQMMYITGDCRSTSGAYWMSLRISGRFHSLRS